MTTLQTGDILHCSGKRLISKLIKWFTRSKFSHTALYVEIYEQPYVIDAQKDGVAIRPFFDWLAKYDYDIVATRFKEPVNEKGLLKRALSKVGLTAYDYQTLFLRQPLKITTGKWRYKGREKEEKVMDCSEYVAWVYKIEQGYKLTPQDVYNYCIKQEAEVIYTR